MCGRSDSANQHCLVTFLAARVTQSCLFLRVDHDNVHVQTSKSCHQFRFTLTEILAMKSSLLFILLIFAISGVASGDTFEIESTPNPAGSTATRIYGIKVIAPNDIWGVGMWRGSDFSEHSLTLHYDGVQWSIIPSPSPLSANGKPIVALDDVDAVATNNVYAVGRYSKYSQVSSPDTFMIHWDGNTWEHIVTPGQSSFGAQGFVFEAVVAIDESNVWFGGQGWDPEVKAGQPANLLVHYNGSEFEEFYLPLLGNSEHKIRDMAALSNSDVWAVGAHGRASAIGRMHVTHWNGSDWSYLDMPEIGINENLNAVAAIATDDVWVSGSYAFVNEQNQLEYVPLFLHWDGSVWSQYQSPGYGFDLVAIGTNDVYGVGGRTLVHWDGQAWSIAAELDPAELASLNAIDRLPGTGDLVVAGWQGNLHETLVARFTKESLTIMADSVEVVLGGNVTGQLSDVDESDDSYLKIDRGNPGSPLLPSIIVDFEATLSTDTPNSLKVILESKVNDSPNTQKILMFNNNTNSFEEVDARPSPTSDTVSHIQLEGDVTRFVQTGTGIIRTRVSYTTSPTAIGLGWRCCLDQLVWEFQ